MIIQLGSAMEREFNTSATKVARFFPEKRIRLLFVRTEVGQTYRPLQAVPVLFAENRIS